MNRCTRKPVARRVCFGSDTIVAGFRTFGKMFALILAQATAFSGPFLDSAFNQGPGTDSYVEQALPLPEGKVLICGAFATYNGTLAPNLCRLNDDGTLDTNFVSTPSAWVRHVEVQPDGKIVIGGAFGGIAGVSRNLIARLNPDGTLDSTFDPGTGFEDKLVPPDPNPPYVFWFALQPDGKIVVTGSFAKFNGEPVMGIVRLNPDGTRDKTFRTGAGLNSWGRFVIVQPNNQILLTGWFTDYNGFSCNRMVRLNPDGSPDPSFLPFFGDKTSIYHAALLPDGKMIVSGHSKNEDGLFQRKIARLNQDGTEDPSFLAFTSERTECVLVQPDGKILVSGWFATVDGEPRSAFARLNPDGSLDEPFRFDLNWFVWNIALDRKGRILLAGGFSQAGDTQRRGVVRLLENAPQSVQPPSQPEEVRISWAQMKDGAFILTLESVSNKNYFLESRDDFSAGDWITLVSAQGTGSAISLMDATPSPMSRCYRVRVSSSL